MIEIVERTGQFGDNVAIVTRQNSHTYRQLLSTSENMAGTLVLTEMWEALDSGCNY